ncbi:MAG: SDR family NAD(P)-dependent oxidoreductase [Nakamurella sp.]
MTGTHSGPPHALQDRTALITGGAGHIGRAIARRFAGEGARVVVADLEKTASQRVASEIGTEFGVDAVGYAMNVADPEDVERVATEVTGEFGTCDAIVVNAGVLILKPALELSAVEWNTVVTVNLSGAFHTATAFGRHLVASHRPGTIVFTSSLFGVRGGYGNAAYSASKFGILGLSQSMATEVAPLGIRVNAVCPGQIRTAMLDTLFERRADESGRTVQEEENAFTARIPTGALGSVEDVANAFLYLTSDQSSYVTGQHLVVDGGWQVG